MITQWLQNFMEEKQIGTYDKTLLVASWLYNKFERRTFVDIKFDNLAKNQNFEG